ncbi:hypothetical protein AB0N05_37770 [Nocardia sp. NPDC051030]|uniref:hypothetical protein n=1 Tax=Nocardia sp. NPDC051030 TaxID=3155162 RepID=UPI003419F4F6
MTVQVGRALIASDQTSIQAVFIGDRRWMISGFRGRQFTLEQAIIAIQLAEALESEAPTAAQAPPTQTSPVEESYFWPDLNLWAAQLGITVREAAVLLGFPESSAPVLSPYPTKISTTPAKRRWLRWLQP